jgi:hypothetical protein
VDQPGNFAQMLGKKNIEVRMSLVNLRHAFMLPDRSGPVRRQASFAPPSTGEINYFRESVDFHRA